MLPFFIKREREGGFFWIPKRESFVPGVATPLSRSAFWNLECEVASGDTQEKPQSALPGH